MRATPELDFALGETAVMIRDAAARFADEQIAPLAAAVDRDDRFLSRCSKWHDEPMNPAN